MSLWYINGMREQSRIVNWWGEKGKDLYWEKHKQGFKFHSQKGWIKYEKNSWIIQIMRMISCQEAIGSL